MVSEPGELVERVLDVVERIPPGRVLSYGDVAELAGAPTPRHVGQVLLHHGDAVAWWRVLRNDGTAAPHLQQRQLALLRDEGTPMLAHGAGVDMRRARWTDAAGPDEQPSLFD
jgi:alkylated DNA nucleotide flippase Atl1